MKTTPEENTREVEEIPKFYIGGHPFSQDHVVVTYKDHLKWLQKAREEEREACAVTVWSYLATFEDCLEPTQRTNALIQAIRLIRDRKTDHSELDQNTTK